MPDVQTALFEVVQGLKQHGHEVDDDTLREMAKAMQSPALMQMMQSGQVTTQHLLTEALKGIETVQQRRTRPKGQLQNPAMAQSQMMPSAMPTMPQLPGLSMGMA